MRRIVGNRVTCLVGITRQADLVKGSNSRTINKKTVRMVILLHQLDIHQVERRRQRGIIHQAVGQRRITAKGVL